MGLFDEIAGKVLGAIGGGAGSEHAGLVDEIMGMVSNKESGGLAGLLSSFKDKGLGDLMQSWIGTGQNLPISPDQIQQGLGMEQIQQIAQKIGVSPEIAKSKLAEFLPAIIDKLTPDGKLPEGGLLSKALDALKSQQ
ncbi:MAG TPA: YidB family protein [Dissulfurispiraceae bacterium]|nr:YidB family protein [Dissulfurispiraceae bacterium]